MEASLQGSSSARVERAPNAGLFRCSASVHSCVHATTPTFSPLPMWLYVPAGMPRSPSTVVWRVCKSRTSRVLPSPLMVRMPALSFLRERGSFALVFCLDRYLGSTLSGWSLAVSEAGLSQTEGV